MTNPAEQENPQAIPVNPLQLTAQLIKDCRQCPLGHSRTNAVPGEGPIEAEVMFIAEGPGEHEDRQGKPFMGPAGRFLDELLPMAGLNRKDVFITNMIKCRAPDNRDPKPEEIEACDRHLEIQIRQIQPKLIVTLGNFALGKFMPGEKTGKARGKLRRINGRFVYPVMHPAAGLRRGEFRQHVINDFKAIPDILRQVTDAPPEDEPQKQPQQPKHQPSQPDPNQASLF